MPFPLPAPELVFSSHSSSQWTQRRQSSRLVGTCSIYQGTTSNLAVPTPSPVVTFIACQRWANHAQIANNKNDLIPSINCQPWWHLGT